ncbi:MAG: glycosyl transferase family 2 [Phyllobacterium sp.]
MISVLIETRNADEGLARTLAALVGGVVEGVIRDVVVVDHGSVDHTHQVADAAGAMFLQDQSLLDGVRKARGEWLLLLEPGAKLLDGWIDPVVQHIDNLPGPARFSRNPVHRQPFLARIFGKTAPLADGLLISKRQALALLKSAKTADDLARGLAARRLKAEIIPAPKTDPRTREPR